MDIRECKFQPRSQWDKIWISPTILAIVNIENINHLLQRIVFGIGKEFAKETNMWFGSGKAKSDKMHRGRLLKNYYHSKR